MLVLEDMLPTLPESSISPRGLLMLSLRPMLMLTTLVDTDTVLAMPDMAMVLAMLDMLLPMVMPAMERGLLMPSPRLMLLFSTELMELMELMAMVPTLMPMVPTPMPMDTDMASKKSTALSLIV